MAKSERLDKLIAHQCALPRSEAVRAIRRGRVAVDGKTCRLPDSKWDPETVALSLDGAAIGYKKFLYLMLNKPAGLLCVSRDPKAPTVMDLVPPEWSRRGLFPAGRLDKDTHGLVILTDDGDFAHRMLSPKKAVYKHYRAILDAPVDPAVCEAFAAGTAFEDGTPCLPAELTVLEAGETPLVDIAVCEGKYHQVKRMCGAHGLGVNWLKRISIGGLTLDESLEEGDMRELTEAEKVAIFG
ncbi:MAG: rRNA pseudouridine synthase [Clostridia bacterium]|nr:rRNA pseudouridine synthase [Clostridia bacterium]MBP3937292.1 rRNA pseudouridine synthase [Clostridia bacterium]